MRDRFAAAAAAEPEVLAHHFTQAGLTDAAVEWWGKAGDQALRRSAFQEAISHLGKAIEMADKEGDAAQRSAADAEPQVETTDRLWPGIDPGQKAMPLRRPQPHLPARATLPQPTTTRGRNSRPYYGQWSRRISCAAELASARQLADILLADAEKTMSRPEDGGGPRASPALTCFLQGAFKEAQINARRKH